jgi:hypothetical protein
MPEPRNKIMTFNDLRAFFVFGAKIYLTTAYIKVQWIASFVQFTSFYLLNGLRGLILEHLRQILALSMGRFSVSIVTR